ncbi:hypothetical protein H6P81_020087 [Aristolochia fimbriata]|uniref:ATP-dependent Clp protease proteolytic subunit n=1 Tax=Aristolochia fimbriata TaxID=158543 RepID=A0AAV7DWR0_ARIFI|nr:hypothetical protein H6P81_020087 [Aristolochia fimbriata]
MATSLSPSAVAASKGFETCPTTPVPNSPFLSGSRLFLPASSYGSKCKTVKKRQPISASSKSYDHIPKQFREENLKDGLKENYKNVPKHMFGLSPSQIDMFMTEDNPVSRQAQKVTEESISSARNYLDNGGMWSLSGMEDHGPSRYSMSVSMYRGGARGYGRPRSAPPDLPSLLLDARICYLGMPIVPSVTELLVAQLMWLDYDDPSKPIYIYINSSGTQNEKKESVGSETEAYAIADTMAFCKSKVYTVNCGMAYGQAALLLALGAKGYRALQPNASKLDVNTDYYIELLAKGTGKTKEEIFQDVQRPKYFRAQEAIDYGLADKIVDSRDATYERRDYDALLAQSKAMRAAAGAGPQAAPGGFR